MPLVEPVTSATFPASVLATDAAMGMDGNWMDAKDSRPQSAALQCHANFYI